MNNKSAVQNFQIPTIDFDRALNFYSKVMGYELQVMEYQGVNLGVFKFDYENGGVGGTIINGDGRKPSKEGTLVYLHAGDDLAPYLTRVKDNGGEVVIDKTELGPGMGYFAIFDDTEGNRVGLFSRQ